MSTTWTFTGSCIGSGYGGESGGTDELGTESAVSATAYDAIAIIAARRGATEIDFRYGIATGWYWVLIYDWDRIGQAWTVIDSSPSDPPASAPIGA